MGVQGEQACQGGFLLLQKALLVALQAQQPSV